MRTTEGGREVLFADFVLFCSSSVWNKEEKQYYERHSRRIVHETFKTNIQYSFYVFFCVFLHKPSTVHSLTKICPDPGM